MNTSKILNQRILLESGHLNGKKIQHSCRKLKELKTIFQNQDILSQMDQEQIIYEVDCYFPVEENKSGGLFFGVTRILAGMVGDEYYMTKGHFHASSDTGEFYWGIKGKGILLFMDKSQKVWAEEMTKGSVHYIPGNVAHRVINIGSGLLSFGACWPSDAGHDYDSIEKNGFTARIIQKDGQPIIVKG